MALNEILITGASGFLGRHLVASLLSEGRSMTLAVRNLDACPSAWRDTESIKLVETGEIENASNLGDAMSGVSVVVHLAGLAHVHGSDRSEGEREFMRANVEATEKLIKAANENRDLKSFIHLSSLAAVTANASSVVVNDHTCDEPATAYGRSKLASEKAVLALQEKGIFSVCLRPPLVIGFDAKGNWGALQRLAATGLPLPFGSVRSRRSMIGVDTLVNAIVHLCSREWAAEKSGSYCVADEGAISLPEIVTELRKGMGMPARLLPFPPSVFHAIGGLMGQQRRVRGLLGDLLVDATRFRQTFDFYDVPDVHESVRESGRLYRRSRSDKGDEISR